MHFDFKRIIPRELSLAITILVIPVLQRVRSVLVKVHANLHAIGHNSQSTGRNQDIEI